MTLRLSTFAHETMGHSALISPHSVQCYVNSFTQNLIDSISQDTLGAHAATPFLLIRFCILSHTSTASVSFHPPRCLTSIAPASTHSSSSSAPAFGFVRACRRTAVFAVVSMAWAVFSVADGLAVFGTAAVVSFATSDYALFDAFVQTSKQNLSPKAIVHSQNQSLSSSTKSHCHERL